jgi:hypothetical protein
MSSDFSLEIGDNHDICNINMVACFPESPSYRLLREKSDFVPYAGISLPQQYPPYSRCRAVIT